MAIRRPVNVKDPVYKSIERTRDKTPPFPWFKSARNTSAVEDKLEWVRDCLRGWFKEEPPF